MSASPRLAVEWEPRWAGFCAAFGPALGRSTARLHLEQLDSGPRPRAVVASVLLHAAAIAFLVGLLPQFSRSISVVPKTVEDYHITYVPSPYLPALADARGAERGRSGKAGGDSAPAPQAIRIANGSAPGDRLVRAPHLKLQRTDGDVANLLSVQARLPIAPAAPQVQRSAKDLALPALSNLDVQRPPDPVLLPHEQARPQDVPAPLLAARMKMPALPDAKAVLPTEVAPVQIRTELTRRPSAMAPPLTVAAAPVDTPRLPVPSAVMPINAAPVAIRGDAPGEPRRAARVSAPSVGEVGGTGHALPNVGGGTAPALPRFTGAQRGGSAGAPGSGGTETAAILSAHPGNSPGIPDGGGSGSFATSRTGHGKGMGGSGGGTGIGTGDGGGSASAGSGPGASDRGAGLGRDAMAHGGTSPGTGPGGAGDGSSHGGVAGVAIESASVVSLPSFASASPSLPSSSRGVYGPRRTPAVTIVGTSRSGGALNAYGTLRAAKVYTVYLETSAGTAVLEYGQHSSPQEDFAADLTSPEPIQIAAPAALSHSRVVVHCTLGADGTLHNMTLLGPLDATVRQRVMTVLATWRFRPALRGDRPVSVEALLGFNISVE